MNGDFKGLFSKEEVNTGRQAEFDYLKGIFMLFIYLVHAFQATDSSSALGSGVFIFVTLSGASIFIFVFGFGTTYSRSSNAWSMTKSGIKMVIYQYLDNLLFVAALLLPYPLVSGTLTEAGSANFTFSVWMYKQYINIFFITGIIYLVLAFLKLFRINALGYLILGVAIGAVAPFIGGIPCDVPVLGYVVTLLIGDADYVSFMPLFYLSYALIGVAVGKMYRRVTDKRRLYKYVIPISLVIVVIWLATVVLRLTYWDMAGEVTDISTLEATMAYGYTHPDIWYVVGSLAHIFLFAGLLFFWEEHRRKKASDPEKHGMISSQILYYSRHISKYYALHIVVYFVAYALHGYIGFDGWFCWILALISMVLTEIMVRVYNYLQTSEK